MSIVQYVWKWNSQTSYNKGLELEAVLFGHITFWKSYPPLIKLRKIEFSKISVVNGFILFYKEKVYVSFYPEICVKMQFLLEIFS